jgi:hypothetical protein
MTKYIARFSNGSTFSIVDDDIFSADARAKAFADSYDLTYVALDVA